MNTAFKIVKLQSFDLCLWLHTTVDPTDSEWQAACDECRQLLEQRKGDASAIRSFVISDGGAPSSVQRVQLFREVFKGELPIAVLTNSLTNPIKRGIATALSWINPKIRVLPPSEVNAALVHIDLKPSFAELYTEYAELQKRVAPVQSLQLARAAGREAPRAAP